MCLPVTISLDIEYKSFKFGGSFCAIMTCDPKNLKIKIYRTIILPVVLYGCELGR